MNWTRIWFGQIAAVIITPLLMIWGATQWVADALGYPPELGEPMLEIFGYPGYKPFSLFWWWYSYDAYAPDIFNTGGMIAASSAGVAIAIGLAATIYRARQPESDTYGSARWATLADIKAAKLTNNDGVFVGKFDPAAKPFKPARPGRKAVYLRHDGPEHILAFAPTRSGKGVGLVVPTLLTWPGSVVVHDLKKENWNLTAGHRARFSHAILFDPTSRESACFNPLLEVRAGDYEVRDVQNIADIIVDPDGAIQQRSHWEKTAHSLLTGAILHVLYVEPNKTLAGVTEFLSHPDRPISATLALMLTTPHLGEKGVHPVVAQCARELLNKSENERSGVLSSALSLLGLYRDPLVARATSQSDFRIVDLMNADAPVSLYLAVPPSDQSRTKPLMRLILNQICRRLTESLDPPRHKLLLMLDEFPALGRLDFFETNLAFLAGYGIRAYLISQSLNQLEKAYGDNNAILDNCHVRVTFATNDERTAKRVSESLGDTTEHKFQQNFAGHRLSVWLGHRMVTDQEVQRKLGTPGEIMQLPVTDAIIMVASTPPIYARKIRYYEDPTFTPFLLPAPRLDPSQPYGDVPKRRPDDWSGLPVRVDTPLAPAGAAAAAAVPDDDTARKQEIPRQAFELEPKPEPEPGIEAAAPSQAQEQRDQVLNLARQRDLMAATARQVEMNQDDLEIPL